MIASKTHVRCGTPDCDWGTPLPSFGEDQLSRCRREFREHGVERHGLNPEDTVRIIAVRQLRQRALPITQEDCSGAGVRIGQLGRISPGVTSLRETT
jgi:hypothetical protein